MVETPVEKLQGLGFSQYEAQAYVALLRRSPLNGYELAKSSGIPRPNVYAVLDKLEERGAVLRIDTPDGARFSPVSPDEFIRRMGDRYQDSLEGARSSLSSICTGEDHAHVWNAEGYPVVIEHARMLLESAGQELLLALGPIEAKTLSSDMEAAHERGVKITTLCLAGCPHDCGYCKGKIYRKPVPPVDKKRWLVIVPDDREVLAGEIHPDEGTLAVRTGHRLLVNLAGWYIRQSIALSALIQTLGNQIEALDEETKATLEDQLGDWLETISQTLHHKS